MKPKHITFYILIAVISSCQAPKDQADTLVSQIDSVPATSVVGSQSYWPQASPQEVGLDATVLDEIHGDVEAGAYGLIDHFMIVKDGKLVVDHAYQQDYQTVAAQYDTTYHQFNYDHPDWHPFYHGTKLHSMQSVTKSVTSLLMGIAWDKGLVPDLDQPIIQHFNEYQTNLDEPNRLILSLEDLLTMRSGILWDEENYNEDHNSCIVMELSEDWIQYILDQPMELGPGTQFEYNSGASVLIGKLLRTFTGITVEQWAEQHLFDPLGITEYYWKKTPLGETDTEGGLYLKSHDLAKIGYLMLRQGMWGDQRVVSEEWVQKSLYPEVKVREGLAYGYQWWVPEYEGDQTKVFAGNGYGGQFLMVAPDHDLLMVFNGWNIHEPPAKSTYTVFQNLILPQLEP